MRWAILPVLLVSTLCICPAGCSDQKSSQQAKKVERLKRHQLAMQKRAARQERALAAENNRSALPPDDMPQSAIPSLRSSEGQDGP